MKTRDIVLACATVIIVAAGVVAGIKGMTTMLLFLAGMALLYVTLA